MKLRRNSWNYLLKCFFPFSQYYQWVKKKIENRCIDKHVEYTTSFTSSRTDMKFKDKTKIILFVLYTNLPWYYNCYQEHYLRSLAWKDISEPTEIIIHWYSKQSHSVCTVNVYRKLPHLNLEDRSVSNLVK